MNIVHAAALEGYSFDESAITASHFQYIRNVDPETPVKNLLVRYTLTYITARTVKFGFKF